MDQPGLPFRGLIRPLAAALQMLDQTALNMAFDLTVGARGVPNGKVVRPSSQVPIQLSNQDRDGLKTLMTVRHFVQLLLLPLDRLLRRKHIQILPIASFQIAIVPKRVAQKVSDSPLPPADPPLASFPD